MSIWSLRRFGLARWLVLLFVAYSLFLLWGNYSAQRQIRAAAVSEYSLQAEKRAAALTDFFATRRADLLELAESSEVAGFFANRDLQMSMEYGLHANLLAIEDAFKRAIERKKIAGRVIYDSIILVDHAGQPLARAGAAVDRSFDARRFLSRVAGESTTLLDSALKRVVTTAPVFYKGRQVGQVIALVHVSHLDRYYAQSGNPVAWDDVLVDAQGLPVFGATASTGDAQAAQVIRAIENGTTRQFMAQQAQSRLPVLLVKWAIEGTQYHLIARVPIEALNQHLTPITYLIAAGSVPVIVLLSALFWGHMRRVNRELIDRYQESDRKHGELAGKYSALELEVQRREAVEQELRSQGQQLEERSRELQSAIAEVSHLARYDSLTGLSNRMMYREALHQAILRAQRDKKMLAVMFLDLDHFKRINDSLGHSAGDRLLQEIARRVVHCIRETDRLVYAGNNDEQWCVARQGGDEFTLLLTELEDPLAVVNVARRVIEVITLPTPVDGHSLVMTCSIGISVYPDDGADVDTLLKNADTAMYEAKARGRNQYQFFEAAMQASIMHRLEMDNDLARALEKGQLSVHYQPIARVGDGRVVAYEALLRWRHPSKGTIAPSEFIILAEESGLIIPLTEFVLGDAAQQAGKWFASQGSTPRIAVNLSGRVFDLVDVPQLVAGALQAGPAHVAWLELELTESTLMQQQDKVRGTLESLRSLGVSISIDDFGTGYSSLSYLKAFPIDTLKIDRSFVVDLPLDTDSTAIVRAIIALAHSLNLEVIAEGVETKAQLEFLRAVGCEYVQGYLIGKPMLANEMGPAFNPSD